MNFRYRDISEKLQDYITTYLETIVYWRWVHSLDARWGTGKGDAQCCVWRQRWFSSQSTVATSERMTTYILVTSGNCWWWTLCPSNFHHFPRPQAFRAYAMATRASCKERGSILSDLISWSDSIIYYFL